MKSAVDRALLWVYCMSAAFLLPADVSFVAASLTALLYACADTLIRGRRRKIGLSAAFFILSPVCPCFLVFSPIVLYSILEIRSYLSAACLGGLCVVFFRPFGIKLWGFLAVGALIALALENQTRRYAALEEKFRRTRDDGTERNLLLKEKNQSILKNQDYEIYTATLKERNRIAREIHDNVGHMLSRSILMVGAMKAVYGSGPLVASMEQLEETLNAAMTSVRESVHDLHDESVNLKETLHGLTEEFAFCPAKLEYDMGYDVPREIRYSFIAIVKEALHNVAEHSDAGLVRVVAREHPGFYQLIVEDDGTVCEGKDGVSGEGGTVCEGKDGVSGEGIGLKNMKDRVDAFGGSFEVRRKPGWRIYITIPKSSRLSEDWPKR